MREQRKMSVSNFFVYVNVHNEHEHPSLMTQRMSSFLLIRDKNGEEDDGYLVGYVHDERNNQSSHWIIDAKSFEVKSVIEIPVRVPYGFHATWIPGNELS